MQPIEILMNEHRVIEVVLNCLEKMAERCLSEGRVDGDAARKAIDFFGNFADRCHHAKEETHLFTMMEAKGFSREGGPTGVMLFEHDQGRQHVRAMSDAIEAAASGDSAAVKQFADHAQSYVRLLREHIQKEDECLYPMATQAFTDEDQRSLISAFEKVERDETAPGTHEKYVGIANELADRFGLPPVAKEAKV